MQADLLTSVILPLSLFLIMFGLGLSLKPINFKEIIKYPKAVSIGLFGQLILLPVIAFIIASSFNLSPEIAVGIIIIALAPGGATSNMFTYLSKGDVALSISLTVIVSFITPITLPLVVGIAMDYFMGSDSQFQLPILKTIIQLLVITVVPVSIGMLFLSKWPNLSANIETFIKWFSVSFMFIIIFLIVLKNSENMLSFFAQSGLSTLVLNITVLILGYQLAKRFKLSGSQSITIGFEVGIQNGSLAMVVAGTLIGNEAMMIPAITYGLLMFVTGGLFSLWLKRQKVSEQISTENG